jgi:hypothetical protein
VGAMEKRRLMLIKYTDQNHVERLKTCLDMCCMPHVVIKEYEFVDGNALWKIYIDRGKCTWKQVMQEVNRVHPVKFCYVDDHFIKNGILYMDCGVIKQ